jgi:hypothetical protein
MLSFSGVSFRQGEVSVVHLLARLCVLIPTLVALVLAVGVSSVQAETTSSITILSCGPEGCEVRVSFGSESTDVPVPLDEDGCVSEDDCKAALVRATHLHPDIIDDLWNDGVEGVAEGKSLL